MKVMRSFCSLHLIVGWSEDLASEDSLWYSPHFGISGSATAHMRGCLLCGRVATRSLTSNGAANS